MLSAEDIAVVKTAIEICNNPKLKREILCASGSDYDINKGSVKYDSKKQWNEIVEKKAAKNLGIAKQLQGRVMGIAHLIGVRMQTWAEYHEGTFGFSCECSVNLIYYFLLNSSFFYTTGDN